MTKLFIKPKRKTNIPKPLLRSQVLSKVQKTRHLHLVIADSDRLSFFFEHLFKSDASLSCRF